MSNLQLSCIHKICCAKTKSGILCKRNGNLLYKGINYCWMHHRLVDENYVKKIEELITIDAKKDDCSICYSLLNDPDNITMTNCKHIFHKECLNQWKKAQNMQGVSSTCPMCRKRMTLFRGCNKKVKIMMTNMDVKVKVSYFS